MGSILLVFFRKIEATRKALDEQHKEKENKKLVEFYEKQKYVNTHFGPEEGEELKQLYRAKRDQEKNLLEEELKAQIHAKERVKETNKVLDKHVDQILIDQAQNLLSEELKEKQLKKKMEQQKNSKAWAQQKEMKNKLKQVAF